MTKEEILSLTIDKLNQMNEEQINILKKEISEKFEDYEIDNLPKEIQNKLGIKKRNMWKDPMTWITFFLGSLASALMKDCSGQ